MLGDGQAWNEKGAKKREQREGKQEGQEGRKSQPCGVLLSRHFHKSCARCKDGNHITRSMLVLADGRNAAICSGRLLADVDL